MDVVTFSSPVDQQVSISVDTIEDNSMTLMQYVNNVVLDDLKQSRDFTMLKSDPNGNHAYSVTYTDKDPDSFKGMEIVTVKAKYMIFLIPQIWIDMTVFCQLYRQ